MNRIQRNRRLRLEWVGALVLAASLLLAPVAQAQGKGRPPMPTGIGDPNSGYMVDDVDVSSRTITMAGETFKVTPTSDLRDAKNRKIRLSQLRGIQSHGVADIVKFESRRIGGAGSLAEISTLAVVDLAP